MFLCLYIYVCLISSLSGYTLSTRFETDDFTYSWVIKEKVSVVWWHLCYQAKSYGAVPMSVTEESLIIIYPNTLPLKTFTKSI